MFLLDTNVVSELRRPERANAGVSRWAASEPLINFFISAITVLELERGVLLAARKDAIQGAVLRSWLDQHVLPRFEGRIISVDAAIARQCARFRVADPRPERDALIAATALVHGMILVTRNVADFEPMGVKIFNPWR